jgi:hypothetical protein
MWTTIKLTPGLNSELTPTTNQAGYTATNHGRFKNGMFQKIGGCQAYYPNLLDGIPKTTHAYQDLSNNDRLIIGTTNSLIDITNNVNTNITTQTITTNTDVPKFSTTIGSNIVTVKDAGVTTITPYDSLYFNTPISVDGIILSGLYPVVMYLGAGLFTIATSTNAVAGVTDAGTVPAFTTTSGSANVLVTFANHGLSAGNDIVFPLSTTVGGITIVGRQTIQSVVDADNFYISGVNLASSTVGPTSMNSGKAGIKYYISLGPLSVSGGYGIGLYGGGTYNEGASVSAQTGTDITATDYSLDNWGELLVANPENDGIFLWGPSSGIRNAQIIVSAPPFSTGAFLSIAQQMIIAYGTSVNAEIGVYQDPLMVKWCDSEDYDTWTASVTNQAGGYRIPTGSKCVGGAATTHRNLIWTDQDLYSMDYIGATLVFSFNKIGSNCGLIAKHAHAQLAGITYWMSASGFFMLSGESVVQIQCPVFDSVFQDLDVDNKHLCYAGSNTSHNEVFFFYPTKSAGLGYNTNYAKLKIDEGAWDIGIWQRNTWMDNSVIGNPISTTVTGRIYKQESGYDDDTAPLNPYFETGYFSISEGEDIVFLDRVFPDFRWGEWEGAENANIQITVKSVNYPGETPKVHGPYTVTKASQYISPRVRARQIMLRIESTDMGSFWRLGAVRVRWSIDGRGV